MSTLQMISISQVIIPPTYATWNSSDKASNVVLSNGNLTCALNTNVFGAVRATKGESAGKWYWEITVTNAPDVMYIGIATAGASLTGNIGGSTLAWTYQGNGFKYNNGATAYGSSYTNGDIIGIAFDADAGSITFYKNNVSQGVAFSGLSAGTYYPVWQEDVSTDSATANFGASALHYTPPSGYNSGVY